MAGIFDIGPLFDQEDKARFATGPVSSGLFSQELGFNQFGNEPVVPVQNLDKDLAAIRKATEERIQQVRDGGLLARYPTIQTPEDEASERARLQRRGLSPDEVDRRIAKFKTKGGKVKTSAKLQMAAGLLSEGIKGFLSVKGRRATGPGIEGFISQAQENIERQVENIRQAGEEEKALVLQKDEREFQLFLSEVQGDASLARKVREEARRLGINTIGLPTEQATRAVINAQAERAKQSQDLAERKVVKSEETEDRLSKDSIRRAALRRVDTAIEMRNIGLASDEDLAIHFEIDSNDTEAIAEARSAMEGSARIKALEDQERLVKRGMEREVTERRLAEGPKETPLQTEERKEQFRLKREREKALSEYQSALPTAIIGLRMLKDDPDRINFALAHLASLLRKAQPDLTPDEVNQQVLADLQEASVSASGLSADKVQAIQGQ